MTTNLDWPELDPAAWAPTKRTLHLVAQMLGKLRLALAPHQPNFLFTSLTLTPRGFGTGPIPLGFSCVQASIDVFAAELVVEISTGRRKRVPLGRAHSVAQLFGELRAALGELGIDAPLSPIPQEVPDQTPLDTDDRPAAFEPLDAQRWLTVCTAACAVFDRWRAHFFGRSAIALWWGGFDLALSLFSGKHVPPPADRGYLFKYDLDAEMMNAGFYPGDASNAPYFYGYIYPQPAHCGALSVAPEGASWSDTLGEWILPYDTLRGARDPEAALTAFLAAIYRNCGEAAGWDLSRFTYAPPPLRRARA